MGTHFIGTEQIRKPKYISHRTGNGVERLFVSRRSTPSADLQLYPESLYVKDCRAGTVELAKSSSRCRTATHVPFNWDRSFHCAMAERSSTLSGPGARAGVNPMKRCFRVPMPGPACPAIAHRATGEGIQKVLSVIFRVCRGHPFPIIGTFAWYFSNVWKIGS